MKIPYGIEVGGESLKPEELINEIKKSII